MIITCEKCGGSFKLDEKLLKPGGTKVRCSNCKHIFSAFPPDAPGAVTAPSEIQLILCEQCGAGFNIKTTLLKEEGTKVRCSKCKHIFLAFPSSSPAGLKEELAMEPPAPEPEPEAVPEEKAEDDWSLEESTADDTGGSADDLDLSLDQDDDTGGSADDLDLSLDQGDDTGSGLSFDLEEDTTADEALGSADELDLSLDEEDTDGGLSLDEDDTGSGLSLDLEEDTAVDESSGSTDELELELDTDDDSEPGLSLETEQAVSGAGVSDDLELSLEDEEIDFSEVDNLLESEDTSAADTIRESVDNLSLSLDEEGGSTASGIEQQEIDLADLEQTIEMELLEPEDDTEHEEPEDVELALADDDEDEDQDEELTLGEGEEADLSDIEEMLAVGEDEETIELDLDGEEEEVGAAAEGEAGSVKEKGAKKKEKKAKVKKKKAEKAGGKSSRKGWLIALVVLLLLAGLGAGLWYVYSNMGFSALFNMGQSAPARSDKVVVMENTIQSDFVNNAKHGKLFIIKGSVKNDTAVAKRFIKVVANLYSEGRKLEMTSAAYCGNILTNDELSTNELAAINARLSVPAGDNNRNTAVKPGMTIPFMIVISEMPEKLVEYEVMVTESASVA